MTPGDGSVTDRLSRRRLLGWMAGVGGAVAAGCLGDGERDPASVAPSVSWTVDTDGEVLGSPVVADGAVYVASYDGYLYAYGGDGGGAGDDDYGMFKADLAGTNAVEASGPAGAVEERWRFGTDGRIGATPAVVDGTVYVGSEDRRFYAVDAATGDEEWHVDVGRRIGMGGSPLVDGDTVYFAAGHSGLRTNSVPDVGEGGAIHAVDRSDGSRRWTVERELGVQSPPVLADGRLYHGCQDGSMIALDAATGEERWRYGAEDFFCGTRAAVQDGVVYAGSTDDRLYALDAATGEALWRYRAEGSIISSPVATEDAVYVGSQDGDLHAVDAGSGEELWRYGTGRAVFSSPAYRDGVVYVGSGNGALYALDATSGEEAWRVETPARVYSSPLVADDAVYFGATDGGVYAVEERIDPSAEDVAVVEA